MRLQAIAVVVSVSHACMRGGHTQRLGSRIHVCVQLWKTLSGNDCRGINEHGGYFGVSARDCKIRGSKAAAGNPLATPGVLLGSPACARALPSDSRGHQPDASGTIAADPAC